MAPDDDDLLSAFKFSSSRKKPRLIKSEKTDTKADENNVWEGDDEVVGAGSVDAGASAVRSRARIMRGYDLPLAALSSAALETIRRELTAAPRKSDYQPAPCAPYPLFLQTARAISMPREYGIEKWGRPATDESDDGIHIAVERCAFVGKLRSEPPQQAAVAALVARLNGVQGACSALLNFPCGYGKTTCAAAVIARVRRRTLVVVGRTCLLAQWCERLGQFLPGLNVGVMQGARAPKGDEDVVVAMLQTLASRKPELKGFGLVVIDEAHHVAARTWVEVQRLLRARRQLALTATLRRGDGLGRALRYLLGRPTFSVSRPPDDSVVVRRVVAPPGGRREIVQQQRVAVAQMITRLADDAARSRLALEEILRARREGHHTLVLSDRISQLDWFLEALRAAGVRAALLTGATKVADRDAALKTGVVLASYGLAAEGLDEPSLSALVLATPRGDVEQAVGRVLRLHPSKPAPLVVDVVDEYSVFAGQAAARMRFYARFGYTVRAVDGRNEGMSERMKE